MNYILFDTDVRHRLLPFTHTRPVADIRCGIMTMRERWEHFFKQQTSSLTESYLQKVFTLTTTDDNLLVNGSVFANDVLLQAIRTLEKGTKLVKDDLLIAARISDTALSFEDFGSSTASLDVKQFDGNVLTLNNPWDIFSLNDQVLRSDFELVTKGRKSAAIPEGVTITGDANIFIEDSAKVLPGTVINAQTGPVYIGKDAEVMEGCFIRGPLALGDHAVLKMGAKVYGATTIGPGSKVGGEVNNVVFFANSNKAHDGFLGNAVIGEWCNLGADTNCSNLKNTYDAVKVWDEHTNRSVVTGLSFCGLMMGDHSKCGINTMFNTGTIAGVACNIFGSGFPDKFIPSFCWGGVDELTTYNFKRAMDTSNRVMARRGKALTADDLEMYQYIFEKTAPLRKKFSQA